jgi:hypothetical protein
LDAEHQEEQFAPPAATVSFWLEPVTLPTQVCPLHEDWVEAKRSFADHLASTTFERLAEIDQANRAGTYQPPQHTTAKGHRPTRRPVEAEAAGTIPAHEALTQPTR